jgi:hypothetical protein
MKMNQSLLVILGVSAAFLGATSSVYADNYDGRLCPEGSKINQAAHTHAFEHNANWVTYRHHHACVSVTGYKDLKSCNEGDRFHCVKGEDENYYRVVGQPKSEHYHSINKLKAIKKMIVRTYKAKDDFTFKPDDYNAFINEVDSGSGDYEKVSGNSHQTFDDSSDMPSGWSAHSFRTTDDSSNVNTAFDNWRIIANNSWVSESGSGGNDGRAGFTNAQGNIAVMDGLAWANHKWTSQKNDAQLQWTVDLADNSHSKDHLLLTFVYSWAPVGAKTGVVSVAYDNSTTQHEVFRLDKDDPFDWGGAKAGVKLPPPPEGATKATISFTVSNAAAAYWWAIDKVYLLQPK